MSFHSKYVRLGSASLVQSRSVRQFDDFANSEDVLMFAVLEQAIEDLLWTNYDKHNKNQGLVFQQDAYAWFLAKEEDYLFSFISICDSLEINGPSLLTKLMKKYENLESH